MIEIFAILLQLLFFLLIFSFPFNPSNLNKILLPDKYYFGIFDALLINGVLILNFLIICSFLNFNMKHLFYILIILSIFFIILNFNNWSKYLIKEKFMSYFS